MLKTLDIEFDTLELISRAKITEQGLFIPKDWLTDITEVEIRQVENALLIVSVGHEDPILQLGREPITTETDDASINHDHYLYGQ